jgi:hypothetical protein
MKFHQEMNVTKVWKGLKDPIPACAGMTSGDENDKVA